MTVSQAAAVVAEAPAAQLAAAAPAGATTALTYTSFEGNSFRVQFAKTGGSHACGEACSEWTGRPSGAILWR
jgi:hypothetical protein